MIVVAIMTTEAESIATTGKSFEDDIKKAEKLAEGMPTWALVTLLIGKYYPTDFFYQFLPSFF